MGKGRQQENEMGGEEEEGEGNLGRGPHDPPSSAPTR